MTLALNIIKNIDETKKQKSRFLLRLIPILMISKANLNDIKQKANDVLEKYFVQEPKSFAIVFKYVLNLSYGYFQHSHWF